MKPHLSLLSLLLAALGAGCATPAPMQVPPEVLRGYPGSASSTNTRYTVRMTDGERDWEFQLPEVATAYEVRVPLKGKPSAPMSVDLGRMTAADRELLDQRAYDAAARAESGRPEDDGESGEAAAGASGKSKGEGKKKAAAKTGDAPRGSYLLTMNKIKELYRTRHYELALVELVALEQQYPDDERILSMKGSLYDKMGNKNLAKDSWEAALKINPYNLAVMEALQRLGK